MKDRRTPRFTPRLIRSKLRCELATANNTRGPRIHATRSVGTVLSGRREQPVLFLRIGGPVKFRIIAILTVCMVVSFLAVGQVSLKNNGDPSPSTHDRLLSLFEEEWQYELKSHPERATADGDNRYNDRLDDYSANFFENEVKEKQAFLARVEAISPGGLSAQDTLSRSLMIRRLREEI